MTEQPVTDYRSVTTLPDSELAARIELALFLKGFSLRGGIGITISSPMNETHIDGFLKTMKDTLVEID